MSSAMPSMPDPFYRDSALFEWIQQVFVPLFGARLFVKPTARYAMGVHRPTRNLYIPPGHPIDVAADKAFRAILWLHGGTGFAPEFTDDPGGPDSLPVQGQYAENVIPILRRPW